MQCTIRPKGQTKDTSRGFFGKACLRLIDLIR